MQELRQTIVPSARAWKLPKLMEAIVTYQEITNQKIFVEYVMLREVNDNVEQAHQLGVLLKDLKVTINLIPWNPVLSPDMVFEAPGMDRVRCFFFVVFLLFCWCVFCFLSSGDQICTSSCSCGQVAANGLPAVCV